MNGLLRSFMGEWPIEWGGPFSGSIGCRWHQSAVSTIVASAMIYSGAVQILFLKIFEILFFF